MKDLPLNSVIHVEREAGLDKVVMSYPTNTAGRTTIAVIVAVIGLGAVYFWFAGLADLFDGGRDAFMNVLQVLFTTMVCCFVGFMGKFAFRRVVPESVMVVGEGIIHDSGVDSFRKTALETSEARQSEVFVKPRKRVHFSPTEVATLSMTDYPFENRIYIETDGKRHDLGEALSAEERAWLYDFLLEKLGRPEVLNRQAADLVVEVEAEERIEPLITDVHSGHRVDPLDFDDPIAQRADWGTTADSSANFQTHTLVRGRRRLAFKTTRSSRLFGLLFPGVGLFALTFSIYQFVVNAIAAEFVFLFFFGCAFFGAGLYMVRKMSVPIVFSKRDGEFRRGWSDAQPIRLAEVCGLQLLSFVTSGQGIHTGYELNLLLRDGSRRHVICHGDRNSLREDTDTLSQFLKVPVFDGIVPKRQPFKRLRSENGGGRSLIWQDAVVPVVIVGAIVVWYLGDEMGDGVDRQAPANESASESPGAGRSVTLVELVEEARRRDAMGDTHDANFLYQEVLRMIPESPFSEEERTRLRAEVANFDETYEPRKPSTISAKWVFPPGVRPRQPPSLEADWATVDLLTETILPEGVTIETRYIKNGKIEVSGYADDRQAVADYLRAIQAEGGHPDVHSVVAEERNQRSVSAFAITIVSRAS